MTTPLPPRRPANPLEATRLPLMPPAGRSRAALGLAAMAAVGRFGLQRCGACGTVQYPPREACVACLGADLPWCDVPDCGVVLAETVIRVTAEPYFRSRTPWRTGLVQLDCGPSVVAHMHGEAVAGGRVRMRLVLDKSGQGVMLAVPAQEGANMLDDPMISEMSCDPRGRRVLVTDGRNRFGQVMARAFLEAGAAQVFLGIGDPWKPFAGQERLAGEVVSLDLTDTENVRRFAAGFGGRIDIVVNTALRIRAGGVLARGDVVQAREEMELGLFGPMRLAQALGPAMRARGADGTHPACAWVQPVSIHALAPNPAYAANAAVQAAALSLALSLRGELRPVRVLTAFVGPLDDDWHQDVPPPKVGPEALAAAIIRGLRGGLEEVTVGEVAQDLMRRWQDNPSTLARELAAG